MSAAWWMLRWRRGWRRIIWNGWGGIQAIRSDGRVEFVELGDRHFATSRLVVLNIRKEKRNMRFPVFAWEQPEAVRRLNQRLQAGRAPRPVDLDAGDRSGV